MKRKIRKSSVFYCFVIGLYSCSYHDDKQFKLDDEEYVFLNKFSIKKSIDNYHIYFNGLQNGTLKFSYDTIHVKYNQDLDSAWRILFLKNNYQYIRDTVKCNSGFIFISHNPNIYTLRDQFCNTTIYFYMPPSYFYYDICYSFNNGIIQIIRKDLTSIEVFNKYNGRVFFGTNDNIGHL